MGKKNNVVADPENDGRVEEETFTEEIVPAAEGAGALVQVNWDYGDDHAKEGVALRAQDVVVPMLKIVQASSKVFKEQDKTNPKYAEGDIYNSVTGEVYKNGVIVVPMDCTECVIERKPAPSGEFIAKLEKDDPRVKEALKNNEPDGWKKLTSKQKTQLIYTEEVPVGLIDPEDPDTVIGVAMIPFSGTNVFPRRLWWNGMASAPMAHKTPRYGFRTLLTTVLRKAQQAGGLDSYKFHAAPFVPENAPNMPGGPWSKCRFLPGSETLNRCADFLKLYRSGALGKLDYSDADHEDSETAAEKSILDDKPAF